MWDDTNVSFTYKPSNASNQLRTFSSYHGVASLLLLHMPQTCDWPNGRSTKVLLDTTGGCAGFPLPPDLPLPVTCDFMPRDVLLPRPVPLPRASLPVSVTERCVRGRGDLLLVRLLSALTAAVTPAAPRFFWLPA